MICSMVRTDAGQKRRAASLYGTHSLRLAGARLAKPNVRLVGVQYYAGAGCMGEAVVAAPGRAPREWPPRAVCDRTFRPRSKRHVRAVGLSHCVHVHDHRRVIEVYVL